MKHIIAVALLAGTFACAQSCVPGNGFQCTPNIGLWVAPYHYQQWQVPLNKNWSLIDTAVGNILGKITSASPGSQSITKSPGTTLALNGLSIFSNVGNEGHNPSPVPGSSYFGPVANQFLSNTYTAPFLQQQGRQALGIYDLRLDNGSNQEQNGLHLAPGVTGLEITTEGRTPGSLNPILLQNFQYSLGDTFGVLNAAYCYGGSSAGGDEGCENEDMWTFGGTVDYDGAITSGGSTGSTTVTVNPTQGAGTQGGGRWLLNLNPSNLITAGTITAITGGGTTYTTVKGSGTSWATSTVNTILGTAVNSIGVATVTPASMSGITTSTVLCIADAGNFQTVIPTVTTGTQFTAYFNKPQLSTAIVSSGGLCGYYLGLTIDVVSGTGYTGNLPQVFPVIRSTSSTSMDVWLGRQGQYTFYPGSWSASTYNTYTLYPGAEVLHVNNGGTMVTNTLGLFPNAVAWANGDTVDEPLYPFVTMQSGITQVNPTFPGGFSAGRVYYFGNHFARTANSSASLAYIVNSVPNSYYNPTKNRYSPYGFWMVGEWDDLVRMSSAPDTAVLLLNGCSASGTCGPMNIFESFNNSRQSDHFSYDQSKGSWNFSIGFSKTSVQFDPTGAVLASNYIDKGLSGAAAVATGPNGELIPAIGSTALSTALVTTNASSDNVTVTGMTSSGHCALTPTNAAAATNIASTYISAKTTDQITVTHTMTANMNYDVLCTAN